MKHPPRRFPLSSLVLLCFVCLGTSALAQQSGESELRASQIAALNGELSAAASAPANAARTVSLLGQRAALLSELIASDPARALTLGLPQDVAGRLAADAPGSTIDVQGEWEGRTEVLVADDFEHGRSHKHWYLRTSQERVEMFFAGEPPHEANSTITVRGLKSANRLAVAEITSEGPAASLQCTTTGVQHIAVLALTTPSEPSFPSGFTTSYFQQLFFGPSTGSLSTDSVNSYWQEASYGQTSATGQVFGPFHLAQDYDCDHLDGMEAAAIAAADPSMDFTQFTRVALMFPVSTCTLSGFGLGGLGTVGCTTITSPSKGRVTESVIWMPIYSYQQTWDYMGATAHELGHNLGLDHDSTEDYGNISLGALDDPGTLVEYGSPFSIMGATWTQYNGTQPIWGQYSAEHKSILKWFTSGGYQQVSTAGTYTLAPYENSTGLRALRVLRDPVSSAWLWLEYRQPIGDVDSSLAYLSGTNVFDGALIHYENPTLDSLHAYNLDFTPVSTPNNFNNAALAGGQSWSDPYTLLTLSVSRATYAGLPVTVAYDQPCATLQVSSQVLPASGGTGTITVQAGLGCLWTASTFATWIQLTGVTSGAGNGTVPFSVSSYTGSQGRNSYITVQRQSLPISQSGSAAPVLISPGNGATGVALTPVLSWNGSGSSSFDVYLGTSSSPPLVTTTTQTSYTPSALSAGTLYYWRVVGKGSDSGSNSSAIWSFTTQSSGPPAPVLTAPANGATGVAVTPTLTWSASSGATSYDVYFGTAPSPALAMNTAGTTYSPAALSVGTVYYWRVVAKNSGGSTSSATWSFTTLGSGPAAPVLTAPANGATGASVTPTLSWSASSGATSYDVYFGTAPSPALAMNTAGTTYSPATLSAGTVYYWRVVAKNAGGSNSSATWSFTTQGSAPPAPVLTAPANGATGVAVTPTLSWSASTGATSYDVYFGTVSSPALAINTAGTTYSPATLDAGTLYYWRVVAKNTAGTATSATWSFTTQVAAPPAPALTAPANGATGVSATPVLSWIAASGATSYDVYFGTASSPSLAVNTAGTTYSPGTLSAGTVYYWRVVAKNAGGSNSSATWTFTTQVAAPPAPALSAPANGATGVSATPTLGWIAASGATSYDVYFGIASPPPLAANTGGTTYSPGTLTAGTVYYWYVVAKNAGGSNNSATWSFMTQVPPPAAPVLNAPANGAVDVALTPTLSWNASSGATSYAVYFGTSSPPPLVTSTAETSYAPGALAGGTVYYWQVVATNAGGSNGSAGWWFTTQVGAPALVSPGNGAVGVSLTPTLTWNGSTGATSYDVYFGTQAAPPLVTNTAGTSYTPGALSAGALYFWKVVAKDSGSASASATWSFTTPGATQPVAALRFVPVAPCRIADTRVTDGPFGGPSMGTGELRAIAVPQSGCGIPSTAQAYSFNVTVVPQGRLSYLTLWPAGEAQPVVSTLNSFEGSVVANAAIVPAGAGGGVNVFVTDPTEVILDIDGYFDSASGPNAYSFYPATPCRIADTRNPAGAFGGPSMAADQKRDFALPSSTCGLPGAAKAYSLNVTVVPDPSVHYLGYLTAWPAGQAQPLVSTLNSWTGRIVANAAIVPAGTGGAISVFVTDPTEVILDTNGYFAAPGSAGALSFYPVAPCRVVDTRQAEGSFGGPILAAQTARSFVIPAGGCGIPAKAAAYSMNVTVVPDGMLQYLTVWPTGSGQPFVSTLNSFDGSVVANAAIVPAGTGGAVSVFVTDQTHLVLDINGYFAP